MNRLTTAFPVMNSADIINEQGLTWQVRLLSGDPAGINVPATMPSGSSRLGSLRSEIAEVSVIVGENFGALFKGIFSILAGRQR